MALHGNSFPNSSAVVERGLVSCLLQSRHRKAVDSADFLWVFDAKPKSVALMVFVLTKIFECILYIAVKSKVNFLYQAQTVKGIQ